jgi:hypothetical protein
MTPSRTALVHSAVDYCSKLKRNIPVDSCYYYKQFYADENLSGNFFNSTYEGLASSDFYRSVRDFGSGGRGQSIHALHSVFSMCLTVPVLW